MQDKKWGNSLRGRPTGNFCYECLSVLIALYPDEIPEDAAAKYHDDPACEKEVDVGIKIFGSLSRENSAKPAVTPD